VPKDIDERKSTLQTPLLPQDIIFEGVHLGRVPVLKFEDWKIADHEKLPHLETAQLMHQRKDALTGIIELELHKWMRGWRR